MGSHIVIDIEGVGQTEFQCRDGVIVVDVDILVLDAAPESFVEDVVEGPAAAVPADLDLCVEQCPGQGMGGEWGALVGVK